MNAVASAPKAYERTTVFNQDGIRTQVAETEAEYERFLTQGWLTMPAPPPPEPEPPMSPEEQTAGIVSELQGLGDQFDAQAQTVQVLEERVAKLEDSLLNAHTAFEHLKNRLDAIEKRKKE